MRYWRLTINIKPLLADEDDDENVAVVSTAIADLIDAAIPQCWRNYFDPIEEIVTDLRDCEDLDAANDCLSDLYDWADDFSVWLGP